MWGKSDEDGCGGEEKERKTEVEVEGLCQCGLEREETVGGEAKPGCVEATCQKHPPDIEAGNDAVEEDGAEINNIAYKAILPCKILLI